MKPSRRNRAKSVVNKTPGNAPVSKYAAKLMRENAEANRKEKTNG